MPILYQRAHLLGIVAHLRGRGPDLDVKLDGGVGDAPAGLGHHPHEVADVQRSRRHGGKVALARHLKTNRK
eukprot:1196263-Prorocentrum_minimum.AAC.2